MSYLQSIVIGRPVRNGFKIREITRYEVKGFTSGISPSALLLLFFPRVFAPWKSLLSVPPISSFSFFFSLLFSADFRFTRMFGYVIWNISYEWFVIGSTLLIRRDGSSGVLVVEVINDYVLSLVIGVPCIRCTRQIDSVPCGFPCFSSNFKALSLHLCRKSRILIDY